ncbi:DNA-binding transcriptional regulator, LysR family [Maritimibacter sp. HL-12]|nr:DNA-binding transcriptional regulator, LysR family [Maritimibacter sp. HL-12]
MVRTIRALSDARTLRDAADVLNTSQSSLSRALRGAEARLGVTLFQRGWSGTEPTAEGEIVLGQCTRIMDDLHRFERVDLGTPAGRARFATFARWRHLEAVAAVVHTGSATAAAREMGVQQPAVSQALRDVSAYVGPALFARCKGGLRPTETGRALAALWARIGADLDQIADMLKRESSGLAGRIAVGMLPFSGQNFVMETFGEISRTNPNLRLVAVPGSYTSLCEALKRREIDLIVGILRAPPPEGFSEEYLYNETITAVARRDHPCHAAPVDLAVLAGLRWMVAPHGTPIRRYFEWLFAGITPAPVPQSCEILSFSNAEQVVVGNDSVALLCYSDVGLGNLRPELRRVDIDLPEAGVPIGITRNIGEAPSLAVSAFEALLKRRVGQPDPA